MKTLPVIVNSVMVALGLWDAPSSQIEVSVPTTGPKPSGKFMAPTTYDADSEFMETGALREFDFEFDKPDSIEVQGTVYLTDGRNYRLQRFTNKAELVPMMEAADKGFGALLERGIAKPRKMREVAIDVNPRKLESRVIAIFERASSLLREGYSVEEARAKLMEYGDDFMGDGYTGGGFSQGYYTAPDPRGIYGTGYDPMAEYIPLMGGPWNKQLYLQEYLMQHAQAFEAYNHNPLAKQLIDLTTAFVFGRGVDFSCSSVEVDEVLREFAERTDYFRRLEIMTNDMWWSGNLFKEWYDDDPSKGLTDFRAHDPSTIWEIVTDPEDIRMVYYYHQQYPTPYQNLYSGSSIKDTVPKNIPVMKYIMRHIPADQVDHVKINCSEWEKYGRSDLFCILGWLKRLKDLLNARVVKGLLEAAFVWDFEVATDAGDVNNVSIQLPDPFSPGSSFVHNKTIQLKPQTATMTHGGDTMPDVSELKSMIATGVGTPKEFIGETQRMSRSASLTTTEPGTKRYERRQQLVEAIILSDFDHVIKVAADAGTLDLEDVLEDARSVQRLGDAETDVGSRADIVDDKEDAAADAAKITDQSNADQQKAMTDPNGKPPKTPLRPVVVADTTRDSPDDATTPAHTLNDRQRKRIQTIMQTGRIARELIEVTFPSIAAEDRSAKLKDLALAEAMEWLPKSIVATLAAKELNITTYDFESIWRKIVSEAARGMSLAHVYGQDNKHVPSVVMAQSVEEEETAMKPPQQQPFTNVPTPPAVAGMKQEPNKAAMPGGGGAPSGNGKIPNSGDTKVNNKMGPAQVNPTGPNARRSGAGSHPLADEGRKNIQQKEVETEANSLRVAIYAQLLREAVRPMTTTNVALARYVLSDGKAVAELEAALESLQHAGV